MRPFHEPLVTGCPRFTGAATMEMRVHGDAALPTLVYLPGLHGDWTLVGSFRHAIRGRVRFVEVTYPRTLTWSLEEYAQGVESALAERGIVRGWLLGESFGSQVVWSLVARSRFHVEAVVLAGGFVRHPRMPTVRACSRRKWTRRTSRKWSASGRASRSAG